MSTIRFLIDESERRFRAKYQELVDTVDGIVWEARVGQPGYTLVSRQAEKILGYPIERWLNEPRFWQSILHPDDRSRLTGRQYAPPESKKDAHFEYRVQTASGKTLWMKDYVKVIHEDGIPAKMRGIMVDITERKNAETIKEQFLANMSHEIRTPLNAIVGMTAVGLGMSDLDEKQKDCLMTIKTAADSLLLIVNDILDYSKIEAGKMELEETDFKLSSLCRNALDVIAPLAKSKGIVPALEISRELPDDLRGDAGRIMQVLMNLLSNATKFSKSGGQVILKAGKSRSRIRIEIVDTGTGVPDQVREKLFLPFSQADPSTARKFGGTGLGLSICKRLVTLMSGEIGLESSAGRGSTFWFEIPLKPAQGPVQDELASGLDCRPGAGLRVLVVDDNFANQKVITRMLETLGHRAEAVANGEEAITSFDTGMYDVILMDCQMPEMDGYEATRQIRAIEAATGKSRTPIIAFTAHALSGDRKKCEDAGMDDYLSKPVDIRQLQRVLSRA